MLCKQCGEDLQETDLFCPKCGLEKDTALDVRKEENEKIIAGVASIVGLISSGILSTPIEAVFSSYGIYLLIRASIVCAIVYFPLKWIFNLIEVRRK